MGYLDLQSSHFAPVMRALVAMGVWLIILQTLLKVVVSQQVARSGKRDIDYDNSFPFLGQHLSSVLQLLAKDQSYHIPDRSANGLQLSHTISSLDNLVESLLKSRAALGLNHLFELENTLAAPWITVLSKRIPAKKQDASNHLRALLATIYKLLRESGYSHNSGASFESNSDDGLVPEHSFPLLRRATVARLSQLWLLHLQPHDAATSTQFESKAWSGFEDESVQDLKLSSWQMATKRDVGRTLLLLFRLHRAGMRARAALEFLHVSKAAGTSICRLAEVSGCRALDFSMGRTCLMRDFDDHPRWINGSHHWKVIAPMVEPYGAHPYAFLTYGVPRGSKRKRTCLARLALLGKYRLNFFANEYTIYNNLTAYDDNPSGGKADATGRTPVPRAPSAMPPSPPSPPAPPQSVVFETIAKQYSSFTSQLFDREENAAPIDHVDASTRDSSQRRRASAVNGSSRTSSVIIGGAELCPQFATMTVLRDPANRFLSHLKFIAQTYASMYKWPGIARAFALGRNSSAWWRAFAPPLFDNYMLRTLGGEAVFAMPHQSLETGAASYMQLAKAMLSQYDVILVLELEESALRRCVQFGLAWQHLLTDLPQLRNASSFMDKLEKMQLGGKLGLLLPEEQLLEQLKQAAVHYDNELYMYGALLAGLDDVVWRVAEESLGEPLPGFRTGNGPPCGYMRTPQHPSQPPGRSQPPT